MPQQCTFHKLPQSRSPFMKKGMMTHTSLVERPWLIPESPPPLPRWTCDEASDPRGQLQSRLWPGLPVPPRLLQPHVPDPLPGRGQQVPRHPDHMTWDLWPLPVSSCGTWHEEKLSVGCPCSAVFELSNKHYHKTRCTISLRNNMMWFQERIKTRC